MYTLASGGPESVPGPRAGSPPDHPDPQPVGDLWTLSGSQAPFPPETRPNLAQVSSTGHWRIPTWCSATQRSAARARRAPAACMTASWPASTPTGSRWPGATWRQGNGGSSLHTARMAAHEAPGGDAEERARPPVDAEQPACLRRPRRRGAVAAAGHRDVDAGRIRRVRESFESPALLDRKEHREAVRASPGRPTGRT